MTRASSSGATRARPDRSSSRRSHAGWLPPAGTRCSAACCRRRRSRCSGSTSASHNPPEYNGVKFFGRDGQKLVDAQEEEIEALLDAPGPGGGSIDEVGVATDSYLEHVLERFRTDLSGLKIVVDSANGAYAK